MLQNADDNIVVVVIVMLSFVLCSLIGWVRLVACYFACFFAGAYLERGLRILSASSITRLSNQFPFLQQHTTTTIHTHHNQFTHTLIVVRFAFDAVGGSKVDNRYYDTGTCL